MKALGFILIFCGLIFLLIFEGKMPDSLHQMAASGMSKGHFLRWNEVVSLLLLVAGVFLLLIKPKNGHIFSRKESH